MKPDQPTKRVDIDSIKLVKEGSVRYNGRTIHRLDDGYTLMKEFLDRLDREHFLVVSLDTKNHPVSVNVCHIGSLNASLVHPRGDTEPLREDIEMTRLTIIEKLRATWPMEQITGHASLTGRTPFQPPIA